MLMGSTVTLVSTRSHFGYFPVLMGSPPGVGPLIVQDRPN